MPALQGCGGHAESVVRSEKPISSVGYNSLFRGSRSFPFFLDCRLPEIYQDLGGCDWTASVKDHLTHLAE
jgi:hypothetical protein